MSAPLRVVHLSNYLRELVADVAVQGKIAKIEGNPAQVAAVAIMSGSIAIAEAMYGDVAFLAGVAKASAPAVVRPFAEQLAGRGVGFLVDKLFPTKR